MGGHWKTSLFVPLPHVVTWEKSFSMFATHLIDCHDWVPEPSLSGLPGPGIDHITSLSNVYLHLSH